MAAPTLTYPQSIDADRDASELNKAFKGMGTNEDKINEIIGKRSLQQRMQIRQAYNKQFGKDLIEDLKSETSGDYQSLIETLFRTPIELLAYDLYAGMKKSGTNSTVINEIICCCNKDEIRQLKIAYQDLLRSLDPKNADTRSLEKDVAKETKPPYETLLMRILSGERKEDDPAKVQKAMETGNYSGLVDENELEHDIRDLYQAGAGHAKKGDPDEFIRIFTARSRCHIKALWDEYKAKYGTTIVEAISETFAEPFRTGMNTMIMAQINLRSLMVSQLHESIAGRGTNEDSLIRIIVLRCEVDLGWIWTMYEDFFGRNLKQAIEDDTSGDFKNLLLLLMAGGSK